MKRYILNLGTALSQLGHALLFGGEAKQTMSARLGYQVHRGDRWARGLCAVISFVLFDPNHCIKAYHADERRRLTGEA